MSTVKENELEIAEEPKRLFRIVEPSYSTLSGTTDEAFLSSAIETTRDRFGRECGIVSSLILAREGLHWNAVSGSDPMLFRRLAMISPADRVTLEHEGILVATDPFPTVWWVLGARKEWLAAFGLAQPPGDNGMLLLQMCRLAVQHRLLEFGWTGVLDRARAIQRSLLPDPLPQLHGFDVAAHSDSADAVGGDVYDAVSMGPKTLALTIADASGHGLPAALEARDVLVGLRMGVAAQLSIDARVDLLNRILCGSTLSSRFVSLVHGELDSEGGFHYVNAGHPPPVLLVDDGIQRLAESGRVAGVSPDSVYRRGFARIPRGGTLLFHTDGVTECLSPDREEFGLERVVAIARVLERAAAEHVYEAIFDALLDHTAGASVTDDATILIVRRER